MKAEADIPNIQLTGARKGKAIIRRKMERTGKRFIPMLLIILI